ncbi:DUF2267 domain-containing protein [Planosporangium mesophilum]|uniref:DUF2267 domain-containing protein n=1 Tax=Planosporangium mesophilum TaxID=689768 RepID=A0A8J3TB29_9ACTN|nr:DUF2267 domain-containing protein [Planosporangium mesophilum]NJC83240.1 DUF2267 domain-containing protein [Planosporangium mesophilum]GII21614.1 hypothetical protein Pme01_12110 [Planosporangium mesophilum]
MKYNEFIEAVAGRVGGSQDEAAVLAVAVLATLAERLTADEAHDLSSELPKALQGPLRGRRSRPAEAFGVDEFVRRVAERAGVGPDRARVGTRAVFATLHEAVSGGEFRDVVAQLPPEFADLIETVPRHTRAPG